MRYRVMGLLPISWALVSATQPVTVPNPGFEEGAGQMPAGWLLSSGSGDWEREGHASARCVSVTGGGAGGESNYWRTEEISFQPGATYRISMWMKVAPGTSGGCIVTGPNFANRDFQADETWEQKSFVFSAPDEGHHLGFLRFGQWEKRGKVYFDDVILTAVQPLHTRHAGVELGYGERLEAGVYRAEMRLDYEGSNYSRCLYSNQAGFNSNRWVLANNASIIYRHQVGDFEQNSARCTVRCGYYQSGILIVEASRDTQNWIEVGRLQKEGTIEANLPTSLFPTREVYVRLRCTGRDEATASPAPGSLQVHGYEYVAQLRGNPPDIQGQTTFLELPVPNDRFQVVSLGDMRPGADNTVRVIAHEDAELSVTVKPALGQVKTYRLSPVPATPIATERLYEGQYEIETPGDHTLTINARKGNETLFTASARFTVPELYAANFGYLISSNEQGAIWWCESPYKISRERPAPRTRNPIMLIEAAGNEYEAAQLVVRPTNDLQGLTASVSNLSGPGGATLPASAITVDEVAYVNIRIPTDATGCEGWWPDPLPPLVTPLNVPANTNQPLWITVHVPKNTPRGDYNGSITLAAENWRQDVQLRVHVFGFNLPDETHVQSGFGLSPGPLKQYHNLETNEEWRQVFDLYLRNCAAHRISPYNPMPFDPIRVTFTGITWEGGKVVREESASGEASLKIVDEDPASSVQASTQKLIAVDPEKGYRLRWACKTAQPGQEYLVTVSTYDVNRNWISGHNRDLRARGTGEWVHEEHEFGEGFGPETAYIRIVLRPAMWSEDGSAIGTAWFDDIEFVALDSDTNLVPNSGFENLDQQLDVEVDFSDFDRAAQYAFEELKLNSFALPVQGMGGGTFHSRHYGRIGPYEQGSPEYERLMTKYLTAVQEHLEQKGWLDKQYVYWFDEPTAKDYDFVIEGMELLKRCAPKLRRMLTEEPVPPLFGAVDLWCPVLPNMDPEICAQRKAAGEDIWWYVCTGPKAPFPTLFIDHNAVEMRIWLWMTWKWNIDGILVWATNYWHSPAAYYQGKLQNPWEDPMSYVSGYDYQAGQIGYWGNGDGRFIYPPNRKVGEDQTKYLQGPVNSIRWELLRDGIEDYEYFQLLRESLEKLTNRRPDFEQLLEIPEKIVKDKTQFTRDPLPMIEHRRKLAQAIERLQ